MDADTSIVQPKPNLNYINCVYLLQDAISHGILQRDPGVKYNILRR